MPAAINSILIKHSNFDIHQPHFHRQFPYCVNIKKNLSIMHFTNSFVLALATSVGLVSAALPKANEYKSNDCSGDLNYGHHAFDLHMVTMDDTTHSVYQAGTSWYLFDGKTGNGGRCEGEFLGQVSGDTSPCLDLDNTVAGKRIRCLCNPLIGANTNGINSCQYV